MSDKPKIAIAVGDPAGIGPEIALKAALDPAVRAVCRPLLVGDARIVAKHAKVCGLEAALGGRVDVLDVRVEDADAIALGKVSAAAGRASIAFCRAAVKAALAGDVDAVVG